MKSSESTIRVIKAVPYGKVCSYSGIAALAGIPNGARLVARILHSCSEKCDLPWWRIVRSNGEIALRDKASRKIQKDLLLKEGIHFRNVWAVERYKIMEYQEIKGYKE